MDHQVTPPKSQPNGSRNAKEFARCFNCHTVGHFSTECPMPQMTLCYNCKELGHKTFECVKNFSCRCCGTAGHKERQCPINKMRENRKQSSSFTPSPLASVKKQQQLSPPDPAISLSPSLSASGTGALGSPPMSVSSLSLSSSTAAMRSVSGSQQQCCEMLAAAAGREVGLGRGEGRGIGATHSTPILSSGSGGSANGVFGCCGRPTSRSLSVSGRTSPVLTPLESQGISPQSTTTTTTRSQLTTSTSRAVRRRGGTKSTCSSAGGADLSSSAPAGGGEQMAGVAMSKWLNEYIESLLTERPCPEPLGGHVQGRRSASTEPRGNVSSSTTLEDVLQPSIERRLSSISDDFEGDDLPVRAKRRHLSFATGGPDIIDYYVASGDEGETAVAAAACAPVQIGSGSSWMDGDETDWDGATVSENRFFGRHNSLYDLMMPPGSIAPSNRSSTTRPSKLLPPKTDFLVVTGETSTHKIAPSFPVTRDATKRAIPNEHSIKYTPSPTVLGRAIWLLNPAIFFNNHHHDNDDEDEDNHHQISSRITHLEQRQPVLLPTTRSIPSAPTIHVYH